MRRVLLACLLALLGGCWSWSFPDELLQADAERDANSERDAGGEHDATADFGLTPDVTPWECRSNFDCTADAKKPRCDLTTHTCVAWHA